MFSVFLLRESFWLCFRSNAVVSVGDPWHFCADPDPHLWLTDPDPAPFQWLKGCKKKKSYFFLTTYPKSSTCLSSTALKMNFVLNTLAVVYRTWGSLRSLPAVWMRLQPRFLRSVSTCTILIHQFNTQIVINCYRHHQAAVIEVNKISIISSTINQHGNLSMTCLLSSGSSLENLDTD